WLGTMSVAPAPVKHSVRLQSSKGTCSCYNLLTLHRRESYELSCPHTNRICTPIRGPAVGHPGSQGGGCHRGGGHRPSHRGPRAMAHYRQGGPRGGARRSPCQSLAGRLWALST